MCFGGYYFVYRYPFFLINLILYMLSTYSFMCFILVIISSLKIGTTIIKIFDFTTIFLGAALSIPKIGRLVKIIFFIIPNVNIYYTVGVLFTISKKKYKNETNLSTRIKNISFVESLIFFIIELIFYNSVSIFIYFYKRSGLNFILFLRSLCCKVSRNINIEGNEPFIEGNENNNLLNYEIHHQDLTIKEQQNKNENNCLKIVGVSKQFGDLKAVNNFSGELFPNEIFCLLGRNGAGKTTLINIISGLIKPEEGEITLNGVSLINNNDLPYKNIALCHQENILFEYLTVSQHLQYIYDIKGIQNNDNEIKDIILNLDLNDIQNKLCKDLSGGQKRKVCIALTLLSGGKVILLDEPTSGVDIKAKKKLWDFLKKFQKEKIILVATHSLEEAEYLGTRLGIISDGHFICSGTSEYLKTMYPCGMNVNLLIN